MDLSDNTQCLNGTEGTKVRLLWRAVSCLARTWLSRGFGGFLEWCIWLYYDLTGRNVSTVILPVVMIWPPTKHERSVILLNCMVHTAILLLMLLCVISLSSLLINRMIYLKWMNVSVNFIMVYLTVIILLNWAMELFCLP